MAGQSFFLRVSTLLGSSRYLLNNNSRTFFMNPPAQTQICGLKYSIKDKLKELQIPEKPKRPLTAYFKFIQSQRAELVKQHPDLKIVDISKKIAADWKNVDPSVKEQFDKEYKMEMEVYAKQCLNYNAKLTEEQKKALEEYKNSLKLAKKKRRLKQQFRDNNKPKKPMTAYMLFVMEEANNSSKSYATLLRDLKGKWAGLSDMDKAKYVEPATLAKKQYEKELGDWEMKMIQEGKEDIVRKRTLIDKRPTRLLSNKKTVSE